MVIPWDVVGGHGKRPRRPHPPAFEVVDDVGGGASLLCVVVGPWVVVLGGHGSRPSRPHPPAFEVVDDVGGGASSLCVLEGP